MVRRHAARARAAIRNHEGRHDDKWLLPARLRERRGCLGKLAFGTVDYDYDGPLLSRGPTVRKCKVVLNRVSRGGLELGRFRCVDQRATGASHTQEQRATQPRSHGKIPSGTIQVWSSTASLPA